MGTSASSLAGSLTAGEREQIQRANVSGLQPVVFVHGLWLLAGSWQRWAEAFEEAGYIALTPGWPGDPATAAEANAHPDAMAGQTVGQVADHLSTVISQLERKPALIGHSFGGLLAQLLAGRGQSHVTVAIDPAPFRGVLSLPLSALKASWPVLGSLSNRRRAVGLTYEQFRFAFANAVPDEEAQALFAEFAVPAPGAPLFQAATANLNPWTQAQVDTLNQERGPLLIISGQMDNTVPWTVANAAYRQQLLNPGHTEIVEIPGRGHSLVIDRGWREVADAALAFVRRYAAPDAFDSAYLDYVDTPVHEDEDRRVTVS
ncbi:MAG: alpha/beta hydrolase [Burkholderiales bacterium]|nr:alpha/beta hydrolase [Burkholderiales bacterium]